MGVEKFAELVKEKSGGKITVKPFPGGVLGPDLPSGLGDAGRDDRDHGR